VVYDKDVPHPLIINFHGMGMGPRAEQSWTGLTPLSNQEGVIVAYPAGMADCEGPDCWASWNASGAASGRSPDGLPTCTSATEPYTACWDSCRELDQCNAPEGPLDPPCNVASCVDDVAWSTAMLDELERTLCIDTTRVMVTGNSMGGLMAMQLGAEIPERISSVVALTSVPMRGFARALVPQLAGTGVSVMSVVGNFDQVMPREGGESYEGFVYDSQQDYTDAWGSYHGCLLGPTEIYPTPGE
jgi:poly(3-hydroxybutyrate) depolymerase